MSVTTQTLTQMAQSIQTKEVITFTLSSDSLNHNFTIVKQCLIKLKELESSLGHQKQATKQLNNRLKEIQINLDSNKQQTNIHDQKIKQLQNNVGDQFMKKMYDFQEKIKGLCTFNETISKLEKMNKFITVLTFNEREKQMKEKIDEVKKIQSELERYLLKTSFEQFKQIQNAQNTDKDKKIESTVKDIGRLEGQIVKNSQLVGQAKNEVKQNTFMIKQINFPQFLQKNRKFKDDIDQKTNDLILKMKKKVGNNQLLALQQSMIDKLDKFISQIQRNKAQKNQTKEALLFLEKRINGCEDMLLSQVQQEDKDALFSSKKWQCASCTKDLGKFEGKLGQYRPWAVFPCKELDPQKTGGFGYLNYLDKISVKKGDEPHNSTQRLNKTIIENERNHSPKRGSSTTARTSKFISSYGSEQKNGISLKQAYFRQLKTQKGDRLNNKFFRVKKDLSKPASELERAKQV